MDKTDIIFIGKRLPRKVKKHFIKRHGRKHYTKNNVYTDVKSNIYCKGFDAAMRVHAVEMQYRDYQRSLETN